MTNIQHKFKYILGAFILLFSTSGQADLKDWTKQEQNLYHSFLAFQTIDVMQTFTLIECQQYNPNCTYHEKNKILGSNPSKGEVVMFKAASNYMIFKILDQPRFNGRRHKVLMGLNAVSIYPVVHNNRIGLGLYIPIIPYRQFK